MTKTMHLLIATVEDPHDPRSWSGTPFHMLQALQQQFAKVTVLSSQRPKRSLIDGLLRLMLGRNMYPLWITRTALRDYARRLDRAIDEARPDAVLCISSQHLVFAKKSELPVFMVSDAPWMAYKMAYKKYDAIPLLASFYARLEAAAARRISGVIYPTPWACNEAITRFDLTEEKVHWISLGANRFCMDSEEQVLSRILNKSPDPVKFLFIGKDWDRKGGPLALQVVRQLNQCGCSSRLKIIGCTPAIDEGDAPHVQVLGYLSPAKLEDQRSMQTAYEEAHFFLVPSHAECYGLVFAEAQSYGLPCISLTSQGIPGVVDSGVTGLLFEPNADVQTIVDRVLRLIEDWTAYEAMATAARRKYVQELNWDAFGARTYQLFNAALSKTQSGQLAV